MGQGSAFMPSHKTMAPKSLQPPLLTQPLAHGTASGAPEANAPFPNLPPEVSSLCNSQKIYPKSSNGFSSCSQQGPLVWPVLPLCPPLPLPLSRSLLPSDTHLCNFPCAQTAGTFSRSVFAPFLPSFQMDCRPPNILLVCFLLRCSLCLIVPSVKRCEHLT